MRPKCSRHCGGGRGETAAVLAGGWDSGMGCGAWAPESAVPQTASQELPLHLAQGQVEGFRP